MPLVEKVQLSKTGIIHIQPKGALADLFVNEMIRTLRESGAIWAPEGIAPAAPAANNTTLVVTNAAVTQNTADVYKRVIIFRDDPLADIKPDFEYRLVFEFGQYHMLEKHEASPHERFMKIFKMILSYVCFFILIRAIYA